MGYFILQMRGGTGGGGGAVFNSLNQSSSATVKIPEIPVINTIKGRFLEFRRYHNLLNVLSKL